MKTIKNFVDALTRCSGYNGIFTAEEVEKIIDLVGDSIFCNGKLRRIRFDKLTDDRFKVYTEDFFDAQ